MFEIIFNIVRSSRELVVSESWKYLPITLMCGAKQGFPNTFLAKL